MKIQYKFVTETVTIEVDDRWGELLVDLNRQEYNNDHKETRRHSSMDALAEQGVLFAAEQDALAALFQESSRTDMLREAIKTLKPAQQRLVQAVYYDGSRWYTPRQSRSRRMPAGAAGASRQG